MSRISAAKKTLFAPEVKDVDFELGAKFWCYFCVTEVEKHVRVEMMTVLMGGLLEHIASTSHQENTLQFFWYNLLTDKKLKSTYLLSDGDLEIFKKASFLAVKKFQKAKAAERKKIAATISHSEFQRGNSVQCGSEKCQITVTDRGTIPKQRTNIEERPAGRRTVSAYAEGLATVQIQGNEDEGNIFTGATPPWLEKDEKQKTSGCIGPTLVDYQKHLEKVRKSKLPASRVGAKFDHSVDLSQNWLPSFGRVWSKGRRLQSKLHFEKEWKSVSEGTNSATVPSQKVTAENSHHTPPPPPRSNSPSSSAQRKHPGTKHTQNSSNDHQRTQQIRSSIHTFRYSQNSSDQAKTLANDDMDRLSSNMNRHVVPYKKKRNTTHVAGQDYNRSASELLPASQFVAYNSTNLDVPYKKNRTESLVTAALIQTPLLAGETFQPAKKMK